MYFILCLLFLFSASAQAEYRVFTLHIISKKNQTTRQIETTLDPLQYTSFYPLRSGEEISYIETWRCQGRTDFFKSHCNNPRLNITAEDTPQVKTEAKLN